MIWPWDTFTGFHKLGFGLLLSFVAVLVIHGNFSYPTAPGWLPDPFFRVNVYKKLRWQGEICLGNIR